MASLDEKIILSLNDDGLFDYFNEKQKSEAVTQEELIRLSSKALKLFIKDDVLCYQNEEVDFVRMPDHDLGVSYCGKWLSDLIDGPTFDIDQGGNMRKAVEAESMYISATICSILRDDYFLKEIEEVINSYNFMIFSSNKENGVSFKQLLEDWQ
jgi:hypothetical protein